MSQLLLLAWSSISVSNMRSLLFSLFVQTASAQNIWDRYSNYLTGGRGNTVLATVAVRAANFIFMMIGAGAALAIIYGGFRMIVAAGSDEGKEQAKKITLAAVVGLVLSIMAISVIQFAADLFGNLS
jgi:hypothetical protein